MTEKDFFYAINGSSNVREAEEAIYDFEAAQGDKASWFPFGGRKNNRGPIEVSTDPGRSLVERITNAIDAVIESEYESHAGLPICRSPKEAATAWLNVPPSGLSDMTPAQRRAIAKHVAIKILPGDGREARIVEVRDFGVGITPEQMPETILSLNESNKVQKHYLAGVYGQGGSSTFAVSKYTLIASRHDNHPTVGFTIVQYLDLPPEDYKTGYYVYLTLHSDILEVELALEVFPSGTLVKHIGYDLSPYPSPVGPGSIYGLLNTIIFDPVLPVWLDDAVHKTQIRRVIKGSRNALNGAVDEGDDSQRGPALSHHGKMFFVDLGDFGRIGIEYWVLERATKENREPIKAFVNQKKPIILTLNGQNHAELSRLLVSKNADLPYLTTRLICHIDCNSLTPAAKRALIPSTREEARRGAVLDLIQSELIKALKSDDELIRLNTEAKEQSLREHDESAEQQMRSEVARLLRIQGVEIIESIGGEVTKDKGKPDHPTHPRRGMKSPQAVELHEPPTYIRIIWKENEQITFYPEQRRYIRIETDAYSQYHNPNNPAASRINTIVTDGKVIICGSTPLQGGRMRIILEALSGTNIGETGVIRVELTRPGLPTLADERSFLIVEPPVVTQPTKRVTFPPINIQPVEGPEDQLWNDLGWPDNERSIASSTIVESGKLFIYYSTVFPPYANRLKIIEQRDPTIATSFTKRYEIWLVVHALILHQDQKTVEAALTSAGRPTQGEESIEIYEEYERRERCRMGTLSVLFAEREVNFPSATMGYE